MIIGTAGHIDHGKTALVRALTGVDTDRLPEERARGISIDLGYAYQPLASGEVLGFVDVPGHERLVHTMVAGATGIDFVLLVIAADDGPMPQTREHLQVLDLLGLTRGAVALTKIDRVPAERVAQVQDQVLRLLAGTALAELPQFPVCAPTGAGIEALGAYLAGVAARPSLRPVERRFRLAVDRSFSLSGIGTLVTGTVHSGRVRVGDRLLLAPAGHEARVRGLHAQDRPAETGQAGQRCALNLAGPAIHHQRIQRGDWVLDPGLNFVAGRLDAQLRLLASEERPLRHWTQVHLHLGAVHVMARVGLLEGQALEPGSSGLVDLVLDRPIAALQGDRFILRDASARRTLGGGRVLDLTPPHRGRRRPERLAWLRAFAVRPPAEALPAVLEQASQGLALEDFAGRWNLTPAEVESLAGLPQTLLIPTATGPVLWDRGCWQGWQTRVLDALAAEHGREPERLGPDRERLRRRVAPGLERPLFGRLIDELIGAGRLALTGPWLHLPDHRLTLDPADQTLWEQDMAPRLASSPYNPPRVRDLARDLALDEDRVRRLLKRLAGMGELFQVAHDHFFTRAAVAALAALVRELADADGAALAGPFRDRIGTGRKVAIQILEFFDRIGYTRRIGDQHRVFKDSLLDLS